MLVDLEGMATGYIIESTHLHVGRSRQSRILYKYQESRHDNNKYIPQSEQLQTIGNCEIKSSESESSWPA